MGFGNLDDCWVAEPNFSITCDFFFLKLLLLELNLNWHNNGAVNEVS